MVYSCARLLFSRDANKTACEGTAALRACVLSADGAQLERCAEHYLLWIKQTRRTLSNTYVIPQPLKCPVYSRLPSFPQHHFKLGPLEEGSLWNYIMLLWIKTWIFLKFKTVPSALASPSPSPLFPFVSQGFLSIHQVFWSANVTGTVQLAGEVTSNGNEDLVAKVHLLRSFWHLQSSVLNEGQIKII